MGENDPNTLRDVEIKRLTEMAELAYTNARDPEMPMTMREAWHTRYVNAVLALNQLLKDAQYKEYEKRLRAIEENEEKP